MNKFIIFILIMFNINYLKSESVDFDIDEFTGYPIVLINNGTDYEILKYFTSNSFTTSTITGLSNPQSIATYLGELIVIDNYVIKRYDKNTLNYIDTIKLNLSTQPKNIIKKDLKLVVIDDSLNNIIEFNKNLPHFETEIYSSSITKALTISYNKDLFNYIILDEISDSLHVVKVINTMSNQIIDSLNLNYSVSNSVIQDNYYSLIYTDNYSNVYNRIKDDSIYTNQHFVFSYEMLQLKKSQLDSTQLIILDRESDTLIYLDYREVFVPENLYPDSTKLISKYNINLNILSSFENNKSRFQLSTSQSFSSLMLDTIINYKSIALDSIIDYNSTYFWRAKEQNIYNESNWSESASFSIIDLNTISINNPINDSNLVGNRYTLILNDTLGQFEIQESYSSTFGEIYNSSTISNINIIPKTMLFDSTLHIRARKVDEYTVAPWSIEIQINSGSMTIPNLISPSNTITDVDESNTFSWLSEEYAHYRFQFSNDSLFSEIVYNIKQEENTLTNIDFTFKDTLFWRVRLENESQKSSWSSINKFICRMNKPVQLYPTLNTKMVGSLPLFEWFDNKDAYEFRIKKVSDLSYSDTTFIESKLSISGLILDKDSIYEWGVRGISYSSGTIYSNWNTSTFTVSNIENLMIMPISNEDKYSYTNEEIDNSNFFAKIVNYQNSHVMLTDIFFEQEGMALTNITVDFTKSFTFTYYIKMGDEEYDENGGNLFSTIFMPLDFPAPSSSGCLTVDVPNIGNYIGIELDTYNDFNVINNDEYEPDIVSEVYDVDHFSVYIGTGGIPIVGSEVGDFFGKTRFINALKNQENIEDSKFHCVKLDWEPTTEVLRITFDGDLRTTYDLTGKSYKSGFGYKSYVYFYACTGEYSKNRIELKIGEYVEE